MSREKKQKKFFITAVIRLVAGEANKSNSNIHRSSQKP
jgi:hypothetical protein